MAADRYTLIPGDAIWILDLREQWRNPLFRLAAHDRKHADRLLRNLNAIEQEVVDESAEPAVTTSAI